MDNNKNDWERIKEGSGELKSAASKIFGALIFAAAMLVGIWAFVEAIFEITLTPIQAILITAGLGFLYLLRTWWSNKQSK